MIDLHMHTNYSDGTDSVKEILVNANKSDLELISITDHNTCSAYYEMENLHVDELYKGNIIVGCEFTVSFDNRQIEVLGYGFDYEKVQQYLNNYYTNDFVNSASTILYNRLIKNINSLGLVIDLDSARKRNIENKCFELSIYEELIKYQENKEILKEDLWDSFSDFVRKGLTNSNSLLFINPAEFKPSIKEIINLVHDSLGVVFLAHPYQYKYNDTEDFLNKIYDENDLDGVECFYTTFNDEQSNYLLNFAKERGLLISGGSDYHGKKRQQHELGVGHGNLNINRSIVSNWNIKYYK